MTNVEINEQNPTQELNAQTTPAAAPDRAEATLPLEDLSPSGEIVGGYQLRAKRAEIPTNLTD